MDWDQTENAYERLRAANGDHGWWPLLRRDDDGWHSAYPSENLTRDMEEPERFEICLGAILTQNTNWKNAERALIRLKEQGIDTPQQLLALDESSLAQSIRSSGYYNQKAKKLRTFCLWLLSGEPVERTRLLKLPGLGPETVDDMLLYAFGQHIFVIDAYTKRLFSRLGACVESISYHDLQQAITHHFPRDRAAFRLYHALIVQHAKIHCRKQPDCQGCPLAEICAFDRFSVIRV